MTDFSPFQTVYLFDAVTGAYTGSYEAQLSPLGDPGTYLMPVCSTMSVPPVAGENQIAVFADGVFTLHEDYRGQTLYKQTDGSTKLVTVIGVLPDGYALTPLPPTPPTPQELLALLESAVQVHIDSVAQAKGYDSANSCISYLNSNTAAWKTDATAMNVWRDAVWLFCFENESAVLSGTAPMPTKEQLLAALPVAPW